MYYARQIAGFGVIAAMLAVSWLSIAWARADAAFRQGTREGILAASQQEPGNLLYQTAAALQAEYDEKDATPIFVEAAGRHPRSAAPRLQLGLLAEVSGHSAEAERWLLEAWRVDRMFETRWTLANFYFRQGREDDFWVWMRRALEFSYGDRRPAFDLCWRASDNGAWILDRAIPEREEVQAAYVRYLIGEGHIEALAGAASKLAYQGTPDPAPVQEAMNALLAAGRFLEVRDLGSQVSYPSGISGAPSGDVPFDWRPVRNMGVTFSPLDAGRGFRVRLSGDQPEQCDLLEHWIVGLQPGKAYTIRWQSSTDQAVGVTWHIAGVVTPVAATGELTFLAPAEGALLKLAFARPRGEVRTMATIDLERVWLE